jgi:hypothetical protein
MRGQSIGPVTERRLGADNADGRGSGEVALTASSRVITA